MPGPGIPEESPKSLPGPSGPGLQKVSVSETVSEESPESQNSLLETPETLPRLFRTLFGPRGRKAPGDSSETLRGFRARRARETPVRGGRDPKSTGSCDTFVNRLQGSCGLLSAQSPKEVLRALSRKSEVSKGVGGQRGLARGNPSHTRDSGLFSVPFFLCLLRIWRTSLVLFGGLFAANPFSPTPFRNL